MPVACTYVHSRWYCPAESSSIRQDTHHSGDLGRRSYTDTVPWCCYSWVAGHCLTVEHRYCYSRTLSNEHIQSTGHSEALLKIQGGTKTGLFLSVDNLAAVSGSRKTCNLSKVSLCSLEKRAKIRICVRLNIIFIICINLHHPWNYAEFDSNAWTARFNSIFITTIIRWCLVCFYEMLVDWLHTSFNFCSINQSINRSRLP